MADLIAQPALGRRRGRALLSLSASLPAVALSLLAASPASAQLSPFRAGATASAAVAAARPAQSRADAAIAAMSRQVETRARVDQVRAYVAQAKAAVARNVLDGLDAQALALGCGTSRGAACVGLGAASGRPGLVVAQGITAEALAQGALTAARDASGRRTWQGASLPVQSTSDGRTFVDITQTESRAILSWDRLDVGAKTTLRFTQRDNGVAQRDWVAVNRVVDPAANAAQILGQITADGTVVVVSRNGMIFGQGGQVKAGSLLASTLDIGNFAKPVSNFRNPLTDKLDNGLLATTVQERNVAFLQNGLLQEGATQGSLALAGMLTSSLTTGFAASLQGAFVPQFDSSVEGAITVERGADLSAQSGGFVILTAPTIANDGALKASDGQVSLQVGRAVTVSASTGASGKTAEDEFVRGLILRSPFAVGGDSVTNTGLVEAARGYASLGASLSGSVTNAGLVVATSSVSRNGMVSLTGGTVRLSGAASAGQAGAIAILADSNGEVIPQGKTGRPDNFKASQVRLGGVFIDPFAGKEGALGELGPAAIAIGANATIVAPGARVDIGGAAGIDFGLNRYDGTNVMGGRAALEASAITVAGGAVIDVSGLKDITIDPSRNSLKLSPLTRNELRDTPTYRETNTTGEFTLNEATVYVDPRITGVRDDGVAYVGSPLIEAGSAAGQIGVGIEELLTAGGSVNLTAALPTSATEAAAAPRITLARDATIDFSGGWVRYLDGIVRTSRLLTAGGAVVDIGNASRNDPYVAVGDGFTEVQARYGVSRTYASAILQGARFEAGYDEGRDAGALTVSSALLQLDGSLWGNAFAGPRQLASGARPGRASLIVGDNRLLQTRTVDIPAGGLLSIGTYSAANTAPLSADIVIGKADAAVPPGAIVLDDARLSAAGLSGLSLGTSASVHLLAGARVELARGGALAIVSGRSIALDGTIAAPSGSISARTATSVNPQNGRAFGTIGSPFRSDDDIPNLFAEMPDIHPFDITVSGRLSAAGLWANDLAGATFAGPAWSDGGRISLEVAPNVFFGVGGTFTVPDRAADLSGSIRVPEQALLDVRSGGYVGVDGKFSLTGKGGDIALVNRTHYAAYTLTDNDVGAQFAIGGINQSVQFTPFAAVQATVVPALVPDRPNASVSFATSSLAGFGFAGGGTFQLVAPDMVLGSGPGSGPRIGLDFLARTGFGTLDLSAYKSRLVRGLFSNGNTGLSAFTEFTRFEIGSGETLDLTQTVLPSLLDVATLNRLAALDTGGDLQSVVTPGIPVAAWDRTAARLQLGGMTELDVLAGGAITGAAGGGIVAPRLFNAGTIAIAGGSITQVDPFQGALTIRRALGVRDTTLGGGGLADILGGGTAGQESGFAEGTLLKAGVFADFARTQRLTNGELFGRSNGAIVIFTGRVGLNEGIRLADGSVTDLSGTAIYNPRAGFLADGTAIRAGRVLGGGTIRTTIVGGRQALDGYADAIDPGNQLKAGAGATIRLDGASGTIHERGVGGKFVLSPQWSDGGSLVIGAGADLSGATLSARGGDDGDADRLSTRAAGGVIDWVAPTLRQSYAGADATGATIAADQIKAAGFDSFVARNSLEVAGAVNLALRKSFIATTTTVDGQLTAAPLVITARNGANGSIQAEYIRLASSNKRIAGAATTDAAGSIAFGASAIDIAGAVEFAVGDRSVGSARGSAVLAATGDIRLIGAAGLPDSTTGLFQPGITGALTSTGDLTLRATQVYATTGTGNLQQLLEDRRAGLTPVTTPFLVASANVDGLVSFARAGSTLAETPLSAGSYIAVRGANIAQDGVLRAPLGFLDIGDNAATVLGGSASAPATKRLSFGADSLTSVSARTLSGDGLNVPYGTTTDLIESFFTPGTSAVLNVTPVGELRLAGADITISSLTASGVRVDARGGGDVFAYEFLPGTGGSRDVLDRLNPDTFSGNDGLQFPDGRQVYAIVPVKDAAVAQFDPIYSADYSGGAGGDLYGVQAGRTVWLDAAPGVAAGEYLLLPAHYALLPGGLRLVENVGSTAPAPDGATTLLDGSVVVGGTYGTAGTGLAQSARRSFTVQTAEVFKQYSSISVTSGSKVAQDVAARASLSVPKLPRDAARVTLAPLTSLRVAGLFDTTPGPDGLGAQVDIGGSAIRIAAPGATPTAATAGYVLLTTDSLASFNANSLSIGAFRTDNADGTTTLDVAASKILVDSNVVLRAPELLLAVGGPGALTIADAPKGATGAVLEASGTLNDQRTGDYIINATAPRDSAGGPIDLTGSGALIRLGAGGERLVTRQGDFVVRNTLLPAKLDIGAGASLRASAITLDSSRSFAADQTATIGGLPAAGGVFDLAISGDALRIGGFSLPAAIESRFGAARHLTYRTPDMLFITAGSYQYNNLTIDAPGIGLAQPVSARSQTSDVSITADHLVLLNTAKDLGACKDVGSRLCAAGSNLTITATDITFGAGQVRTWGFDSGLTGNGVTLAAREGMYVTGSGGFSMVNADESIEAPLNLITPFIVDATGQDLRRSSYVRPDYTFATVGAINVTGTGLTATPAAGSAAPGARIAFQTGDTFRNFVDDVTVTDALIRATAGTVDVAATGSILLRGTASLQAPGFVRAFDDGVETMTVSAGGGLVDLVTLTPGAVIDTSATSSLVVDNLVGTAGTLRLVASSGEINLRSQLNPGIAPGTARTASLIYDAGQSAFDLGGFVTASGDRFQGTVAVRSGAGNLDLAAKQTLRAQSVSLTADGGLVTVAGTIDTSGADVSGLAITDAAYKAAKVDGGAISLYGRDGVSLAGTAALLATTRGYAAQDTRQAKGGAVTLGVGVPVDATQAAPLTIAAGATIDVSALRPGDRAVAETVVDPTTRLEETVSRLAPGDLGGTVAFRAPLLADNTVDFSNAGTITGASAVSLEAYRRFDLDRIAGLKQFSGVTLRSAFPADILVLDPAAAALGRANFLTDLAPGTLPDFIRNFTVSARSGQSLAGYRVRPGVELSASGDIQLANAWNLAAGEIVNADGAPGYADAVAAGLLVPSALGTFSSGALAGQTAWEVVPGKEAELFSRFVRMVYRVGGRVGGEAPVLALRSGRGIDITRSISDGFFAFHDLTNPDYIDYQLGGGKRTYNPALRINCGIGDAAGCDDSIDNADAPTGIVAGPAATRVTILIGAAQQGGESSPAFIAAPYNPQANAAAPGGTGDPLGVAELFPRLTDGSAVHSSDIKLVAGAAEGSANPLQVDLTRSGTLKVSGETSYTIAASKGTAAIDGHFQLLFDLPDSLPTYYDLDDLLALIDSGRDPQFQSGYYTVLNWGVGQTGAAGAARQAALAYAPFAASGHFLGAKSNPTGVSARLRDIVAFLRDSGYAETFADGVTRQLPGYAQVATLLAPVARLQNDTAYVGTIVRSGDGSISLAAADDIDLRRTPALVSRRDPSAIGGTLAQVGGNAVYTAGVRAVPGSLRGAIVPAASGIAATFVPGPTSGLLAEPVLAEGGGAVTAIAGRDVIGRRDFWGENFGQSGSAILGVSNSAILDARGYGQSTAQMGALGSISGANSPDQRWRYGVRSFDEVRVGIAPNLFSSGLAALSGGNVVVSAGRDVTDLTVALTNSMATSFAGGTKTLVTLGNGDLAVDAGRTLAGGQFDIASGKATLVVRGEVTGAGVDAFVSPLVANKANLLRLRVGDATATLSANGAAAVGGLGALGVAQSLQANDAAAFFSPVAGVAIQANGAVDLALNRSELTYKVQTGAPLGFILPPSLEVGALLGDISVGPAGTYVASAIMAPSRYGQLSLLAGGNIADLSLAMSDAVPTNYFGAVDAPVFPRASAITADSDLRDLHNKHSTHLGDDEPARIVALGSIDRAVLSLPKQARIRAEGDIVNLQFQGQNLLATDTTSISAGHDITGTTGVVQGRSGVLGNNIVLGGPGTLLVEAGRNIGPFVSSVTGNGLSEAGGIRTVGNDFNPWLAPIGADIRLNIGVANGLNYAGLQSTYLDPANLARLDGDLFVQREDELGNLRADRSKFVYAPVLASWLSRNAPAHFAAVFGSSAPTGDALAALAYTRYDALYAAFAQLAEPIRNRFLIDELYFGELGAAESIVVDDLKDPGLRETVKAGKDRVLYKGVRGYRAAQVLFPSSAGYTDNFAPTIATTAEAKFPEDHPGGIWLRIAVDGKKVAADRRETGNADLRLSTIETTRGGNITIVDPGGNFIAGSQVRTEAQVSRRATVFNVFGAPAKLSEPGARLLLDGNYAPPLLTGITAIPLGFEGILTLRGGKINTFTDGSFILNQSRLFSQRGGDITMWSSNADLNAGQGPRSSSNFPPIVLRFNPNGYSEVDTSGSVSGAGIGTFRETAADPVSSITLVAPMGTVDAGDAGVRSSGNIRVVADIVRNAKGFSGATLTGALAAPAAPPPAPPASADAATAANAFKAADAQGSGAGQGSRIFVDVLGNFGGSACPEGQAPGPNGQCQPQ